MYSQFWLGFANGLLCLSDAWRGRDEHEADEPLPNEEMHAWLRLPEQERNAVTNNYSGRRILPSKRSWSTAR